MNASVEIYMFFTLNLSFGITWGLLLGINCGFGFG